jgi:hypothetical protein
MDDAKMIRLCQLSKKGLLEVSCEVLILGEDGGGIYLNSGIITSYMVNEINLVDPRSYAVDLYSDPIGIGESRVFSGRKNGERVALKVFAFGLPDYYVEKVSLEQVLKYVDIADRASEVSNGIRTSFDTPQNQLTWEVVPVEAVRTVEYGDRVVPCTISRLVEGVRLDEDEEFRHKLEKVSEARGVPRGDLSAEHIFLDEVTNQLREMVGDRAIRLAKVNVKAQRHDGGYRMVVTDVCAELSRIEL